MVKSESEEDEMPTLDEYYDDYGGDFSLSTQKKKGGGGNGRKNSQKSKGKGENIYNSKHIRISNQKTQNSNMKKK